MAGQRLGEVISQVSAEREAVGDDLHQLALGAVVLEEHDQL